MENSLIRVRAAAKEENRNLYRQNTPAERPSEVKGGKQPSSRGVQYVVRV